VAACSGTVERMITAEALSKSYAGTRVVRDVSFTCAPGTITGFLGPNGAGKSTTLRMITGLSRPDAGASTIDGQPFASLPNPSRVVGTLLDPSAMHPGRTGRGTLTIAARMADVPLARVDECLSLVGLAGAGERRVGNYSLGMRQRLGIAQALLASPSVLILDEPANGLDPEGIAWMRRLLRGFADRGGTVLLSSHLLSEVQASVDHLVVIAGGTVVAAGTLSDLLASGGLLVRAVDADALARMLTAGGIAFTPAADAAQGAGGAGGAVVVDTSTGILAEDVAQLALAHQVLITELRPCDATGLEDLFFALTNSDSQEAA
jgi:ABC-2 type transport system ATP-binding protein